MLKRLLERLLYRDWETDDEWNSLSDVQKAFITEYVSIMDSYFIGNDALANQVAVTTPNIVTGKQIGRAHV